MRAAGRVSEDGRCLFPPFLYRGVPRAQSGGKPEALGKTVLEIKSVSFFYVSIYSKRFDFDFDINSIICLYLNL